MPRYDFACDTCEIQFEEKRPFARVDIPAECPLCHDFTTRKVITAVTVIAAMGHETAQPVAVKPPPDHGPGCRCCRG